MLTIRPLDIDSITPLELFLQIPADEPGLSFLCSDGSQASRYSVLAARPTSTIRYDGKQVFVNEAVVSKDLDQVLNALLEQRSVINDAKLPFLGGLIGLVEYEYGYECLDLINPYPSNSLVLWQVYDHALLYDHLDEQWLEVLRGDERRFNWEEWLTKEKNAPQESITLTPTWDFSTYQQKFDLLKENIRLGELYQACLSFPFIGKAIQDPRALFAQLFQQNPASMAAYLETAEKQILSLSPERFIQWDGNILDTKPIKGTRPRSEDVAQDKQLAQDLLKNEKEMAELNMITDLLRNDLAKVSRPGTVHVVQHQELMACPTVWHAYSHIRSQSLPQYNAWNILRSMFPGGSISGCPKRRAVELLAGLESSARGIYTGSIGYISDHGKMDMNIAIRSLECSSKEIKAGFGGGIVFDSLADQEYQECFVKARSLVPDLPLPSATP